MEALLAWAAAQGARWPKLTPKGRTFAAVEGWDAGPVTTLISVPLHLLLTVQEARRHPHVASAFDQLAHEGAEELDLLILMMAVERSQGAASRLKAYLDVLPAAYTDPLWWDAALLEEIEGTDVAASLAAHREALRSYTEHWGPRLVELARTAHHAEDPGSDREAAIARLQHTVRCPAAMRWCRSAVISRCFSVRFPDGSKQAAMVPVVDMLDHNPAAQIRWEVHSGNDRDAGAKETGAAEEEEANFFHIKTISAVAAGELVYNNYSNTLDNARLLLGYGFALYPNASTVHTMQLASAGLLQDPDRAQLLRWGQLGLRHECSAHVPIPDGLLATLQVGLAPDFMLPRMQQALVPPGSTAQAEPDAAGTLLNIQVVGTLLETLDRGMGRLKNGSDLRADSSQLQDASKALEGMPMETIGERNPDASEDLTDAARVASRYAAIAYRLSVKEVIQRMRDELQALLSKHASIVHKARLASAANVPVGATAAWLQAYKAWVSDAGLEIEMPKLTVVAVGPEAVQHGEWTSLALQLTSPVQGGDVLASVPAEMVLTAAKALGDTKLGPVLAQLQGIDERDALILAVLFERMKGPESQWNLLLNHSSTLVPPPLALAACPNLVDGTALSNATQSAVEDLQMLHSRVESVLPLLQTLCNAEEPPSYLQLSWASTMVDQTCVQIPVMDGVKRHAMGVLAPCIGMLSRSSLCQLCTIEATPHNKIVLRATCSLPDGFVLREPGEWATSVDRLLVNGAPSSVGAVSHTMCRAYDYYELCLATNEDDEEVDMKRALLQACGLSRPHFLEDSPEQSALDRVLATLALCLCPFSGDDEALVWARQAVMDAEEETTSVATERAELFTSGRAQHSTLMQKQEQLEARLKEAVTTESLRRDTFECTLLKDRKRSKIAASNLKAILESILEELGEHASTTVEDAEEGKPWIEAVHRYQAGQAAILASWLEALHAKRKDDHREHKKSKTSQGVKRRAEQAADDDDADES